MSNQVWSLVSKSLNELESFFDQFAEGASDVSLFIVALNISGAQIRFNPPLSDIDSLIMNVLEEIVAAVKDIPRIETKLFTSLQGETLTLPSISIQDDRINEGKFFRKVVAKNTIGPQKHILNYDKFKLLMTHKAEKRIDDFLREKHDLDEYEAVRQNDVLLN
jgi:dynein heavy chain